MYFSQNLKDPDQTRTMLGNMQQFSEEQTGLPLFLGVDEEGGTVVRIADNAAFGVENIGDMADIGATGLKLMVDAEKSGKVIPLDKAPEFKLVDSILVTQ